MRGERCEKLKQRLIDKKQILCQPLKWLKLKGEDRIVGELFGQFGRLGMRVNGQNGR